jgi:hypothetical protein
MQTALKASTHPQPPRAEELPPPPSARLLGALAIGETSTVARIAMLYLQAYDYNSTNSLPYRNLDYDRLIGWLKSILEVDPLNEYPLFAAARIYAEVPDTSRQRKMLEFIYSEYLADPNRRWPWAAHAALVAKHRLKDLPLALKFANAIDELTTAADVPFWARHMGIFILEDMNELDAARILLGGLLTSGKVKDEAESRFLQERLKRLEAAATSPVRQQ